MLFLHNIRSVAKYESIILTRSWFFKIFTILALLSLGLYNLVTLVVQEGGSIWVFKAIPSNIPYVNLLLLNTGQAIIAIFLSSEFLKRDKKLDTSEVFYVRPLSNAEYVIGKIWGNLKVFLSLNLIIMGMTLLFNYLAPGATIDWYAYIIYFLLISIPTLIFIIGLSVFLMLILKNQALTFIILLGYIGITIFYISDKFYYLFDYMAYSLPLVKSSIVGFTNWETVLNHRAIYLFAGLAFLFFTISLFGRLPNSRRSSYPWIVLSCVVLVVCLFAGYNHIYSFTKDEKARKIYVQTNNKYVHNPKMVVKQYDLSVEQQKDHIIAEAKMTASPLTASSVFTFCLNPGLEIQKISNGTRELEYTRDNQIILVDFGETIHPEDSVVFSICYSGQVNDNFCYLDIPNELLQAEYKKELLNTDKKYSIQTKDYLLLTPETYWYPRPGTSYSDESPDWQQFYFSDFNLTVKPLPDLVPLSVGESKEDGQGSYIFSADQPSQSIPLIVGKYKQKSIESDSTLYNVWYIDGHDYFSASLDTLRDTIPTMIQSVRDNLERTYRLNYPFKRFSIIEVPAQFYTYSRTWSQAQETVLPEMVLFPEKGWIFDQLDFERSIKNQVKWSKGRGQEINEYEAKMRSLNMLLNIFLRTEGGFNISSGERGSMELTTQANPYFLFPQLYNFRYNIFSSEWPVANRLIELYIQNKSPNMAWERNINGLSNDEKANLLMEEYPFVDLLSNIEHRDLLDNIIRLKGQSLFANAEFKIGVEAFRDALYDLLERNTFENIQFENLLDTLEQFSEANIKSEIAGWTQKTQLPYYIINQPEVVSYYDRGLEDYVLKLTIRNDSDVDGMINVNTTVSSGSFGGFGGGRGGGGGGFGMFGGGFNSQSSQDIDPRTNRKLPIAAHQSIQIVSIWEDAPRQITINTMISKNLPSIVNLPIPNILQETGRLLDVEGDYILSEGVSATKDEVIVDNEDPLFSLTGRDMAGLLPQWLDKIENNSFDYAGIPHWRPPLFWTATTNAGYYGSYIRSAYVVKSGDGSQKATWKVPVPSPGHYEVYYWIYNEGGRGGRGGRGGGGRDSRQQNGEYHFKVKYDEEEPEDAYLNMRRTENGWNQLGVYYLGADTISVTLSNNSKLNTVTADAVKIVKRQ
ncbi:xanthan lyase [Bacteroidales bacterium OttesenSCG-928-A17]|nr:xanthan lyase [Bacteroidales bacterium OttesenSCG-928-A17]